MVITGRVNRLDREKEHCRILSAFEPVLLEQYRPQGRLRLGSLLLVGVIALALLFAGCSSDSDDSDDADTESDSSTEQDSGSGAAFDADREAAIAVLVELYTATADEPYQFFSPVEARCIAERVVSELDPSELPTDLTDLATTDPASQPDIDFFALQRSCINGPARLEQLLAPGIGAEAAACVAEQVSAESAYAYAVGPFLEDADVPPEDQAAVLGHIEACQTG